MFNICLLNLFIYFVLGYHIRWRNKAVGLYYIALPRTSLEPDLVPFPPCNFTDCYIQSLGEEETVRGNLIVLRTNLMFPRGDEIILQHVLS